MSTENGEWLTVVVREGVPEVLQWDDYFAAVGYWEDAGAQWSEAWVCRITPPTPADRLEGQRRRCSKLADTPTPPGEQDAKRPSNPAILKGAIGFLRENWHNDGAEGESVHLVCRELERMMGLSCIQCANPRPHFCVKCRGYSEWREKQWQEAIP